MTSNSVILKLLDEARVSRLFGSLTLQFKNGEIVLVRREETLTPGDMHSSHSSSSGRPDGKQSY